jgi:glycosyltransferase involved in cell wall biosynthesis
MILGFDARMLFGKWRHRGIGGYILSLLKPLDKKTVLSFVPKTQQNDDFACVNKGISFFPIWEQLLLPIYIYKNRVLYFLYPSITAPIFNLKKVKKIFVVYDLIFLIPFNKLPPSKSIYNNLGRIYRRLIFPHIINSSNYIVSISEYTKSELNQKFNIPLENIHVIPCSITNDWFVKDIIPLESRDKYFISVTGDAPSKNLDNLLLSFNLLKKENKINDFKLRLVGINKISRSKIEKKIKLLDLESIVVIENFLDKTELQYLYRNAWASLTLSLYEGFGVPVIESMASGTPVVCSNTTSLPEVAGGCAILIDPNSINEIKDSIIKIMNLNNYERTKMSLSGFNNANIYNEINVSKIISNFWEQIIKI